MQALIQRSSSLQGIAMMLLAVFLFAMNDVLLKWMVADYHPLQVLFLRALFSILPLAYYLRSKTQLMSLRTNKWGYHAMRTFFSVTGTLCFIYAFMLLPLADVYANIFIGPLCMAIYSIPILGEKVEKHAWWAIGLGFIGVLIMMRPGSDTLSFGGLVALGAGFIYSLSLVMSRKLSQTESNFSITTWTAVGSMIAGGIYCINGWVSPSLMDWGLFAITGILGGSAQLSITHAFKLAPASIVGPIDYFILVWGVIFGYLIWGDVPDQWMMTGAFILVISGLLLIYFESRKENSNTHIPLV